MTQIRKFTDAEALAFRERILGADGLVKKLELTLTNSLGKQPQVSVIPILAYDMRTALSKVFKEKYAFIFGRPRAYDLLIGSTNASDNDGLPLDYPEPNSLETTLLCVIDDIEVGAIQPTVEAVSEAVRRRLGLANHTNE